MDLDELRDKWAEHDRKLDTIIGLNRQLLGATKLNRARSSLQRFGAVLAVEAVFTVAAIGALGSFIYDHLAWARFVVPAVLLDVYAIAFMISVIRQIAAVVRIDYGAPIATIQKQLLALSLLRFRHVQWAVLAGVPAWTLFVIVALQGFFGVDVYQSFGVAWVSANLLFGVAIIPLAIWLSKTFGNRMRRSPAIQRFMRDLAGYNLNAALGFLASLVEFENEISDR